MRITDTSKQLDLETWGKVAGGPRTSGLHVSEIYRDIELTLGKYKNDGSEEDRRRGRTFQLGGFLWEGVFASAFASLLDRVYGDLVIHPEVERDGIIGSPDLLDVEEEMVIDTKMTWKGSGKLEDLEKNFWAWTIQLKAYCAMLEWRRARLVVFFVNGDYRESGPQIRQLDLEFTTQEVEETWAMLRAHAKRRGMKGTNHASNHGKAKTRKRVSG